MSIAQTDLREPERVDWDLKPSSYAPPPVAVDGNGKPITYYGTVGEAKEDGDDNGYLQFMLDPIKEKVSGTILRFTRASTKPFTRKNRETGEVEPMKGNPNRLSNFLKAVGLAAKPQTNAEYRAAVKAAIGRTFGFTIDWEAYNKDTGERVKGYLSFPDDPERPGMKKSILRAGDVVTERDNKGNITGTRTIQSEILFANPRLKYFQDATPKVGRG